jgi:TIR domain/GUN4-like
MKNDPAFFISYSRKDFSYVARLVRHLRGFDLPVWFDGDLRVGTRFSREIRQRIMCALAVIVVMSPAAEASEWVEKEILEAQHHSRDFVPILLEGSRLFLLASSHYFDARNERLPDDNLIGQLRDMCDTAKMDTRSRFSFVSSAPVEPPAARTIHIPTGVSLQKLCTFLKDGEIEHADIFTTSLLLDAVCRLDSGWMRRVDGDSLSFSLLADIDEVWSRFSHGTQGFRSQLSLHRHAPKGAPAGGQRDFAMLALLVGWKNTPHDPIPGYQKFVATRERQAGFFPTLRNPQMEQHKRWHDQWVDTVMAVHLRLRTWEE